MNIYELSPKEDCKIISFRNPLDDPKISVLRKGGAVKNSWKSSPADLLTYDIDDNGMKKKFKCYDLLFCNLSFFVCNEPLYIKLSEFLEEELKSNTVEFLEIRVQGKNMYLLNVVGSFDYREILVEENSLIEKSAMTPIVGLYNAHFKDSFLRKSPKVFCINRLGKVFVSQTLVDFIIQHKFSGFVFEPIWINETPVFRPPLGLPLTYEQTQKYLDSLAENE